MRTTLGLCAALLVAVVFPSGLSQVQLPPAKCDPTTGFDWAFNSKNQSPCDVAAYLGGVCNAGQFGVPALNASQAYQGPTLQTANSCRCNTVFYSLLSACAACQNRVYIRWSLYSVNCSTIHTNFPGDIPSGTAVPSWAYLDVTTTDTFEPNVAKLANGPESTASPKPTGPSTSVPPPESSISTAPPQSSDSGDSSNAGAIAGGVVGGVAGLGIIAVLAFWFLRRRKYHVDPSFDINAGHLSGPPMSPISEPSTRIASPFSMVSSPPPKLYDPSDPSTFPDAVGMQSHSQPFAWQDQTQPTGLHHYRSQSTESSMPGNASIYSTPSGHHRNYSGTAEI